VLRREQDVAADIDLLLAGLDEVDVDRPVVGARGGARDRRLRGAAGVRGDFEAQRFGFAVLELGDEPGGGDRRVSFARPPGIDPAERDFIARAMRRQPRPAVRESRTC
jgi:hypothetical protein